MTSGWIFLSTLNYDAWSTTHQIHSYVAVKQWAISTVIVEMWKAHVRLIHAYPLVPQCNMDIIKTEPHSDSESNPSSPLIKDVIRAELQGLPMAVIKNGASVSWFLLLFMRE